MAKMSKKKKEKIKFTIIVVILFLLVAGILAWLFYWIASSTIKI